MRIFLTGGTGTVGSATVRELRRHPVEVAVMTHSPEKIASLPEGVRGVVGDLRSPDSLERALAGGDRLFLITPLSPTETEEGLNAIAAARRAGVERVVLLSVHQADAAPHIPHFRSKLEMEKALRQSGMAYTVLMPDNFFQNDYWSKQAMLEFGVYPQPVGDIGTSRVDVRDIADGAVKALLEDGHQGQRYPVVGKRPYSGAQVAEVWSRHLGREVRYMGNDLEAWAAQASQMLPAWMVDDLKVMYGYFQEHGLIASDAELERQARLLGREPRDFEDFVAETARAWAAEPSMAGEGAA